MIFVILLFVSVVLYVKIQYFNNLGYKFFIYIVALNSAIEISLIYFQNNNNKSQINCINKADNNDDDCDLKNKINSNVKDDKNIVAKKNEDIDKQHKLESDESNADVNQSNFIANENEADKSKNNQSNAIIEMQKIEDSDGRSDIKSNESNIDIDKNDVDIDKNDIDADEDKLENNESSIADESNYELNKNMIAQEIDDFNKKNDAKSEALNTNIDQNIDIDKEYAEIKKLEKFDQNDFKKNQSNNIDIDKNNNIKKEDLDIQPNKLTNEELNALKISEIYDDKSSDIEIQKKINANSNFDTKLNMQKIFNIKNTSYNYTSNSQRSMIKLIFIAIVSYCFDIMIAKFVSNVSMQKLIIACKLFIYLKSFSIKGILLCAFKIILWLTIFAYYKDFFANHRVKKHIAFTFLYALLYCMEFQ